MSSPVPQTFRRESRLFLWIALLLVLFLNVLTLILFRRAAEWGSAALERRGTEILKRLPPSAASRETTDEVLGRSALAQDLVYAAIYDEEGRRLRTFGEMDAPESLSESLRPAAGEISLAWRRDPTRLIATRRLPAGFALVALDPAEGAALRSLASALTVVVPIAGAALVVLAGFYLRSLLDPYDRLLAAAGGAPEPPSPATGSPPGSGDERDFLVSRFEATIAALREKERELKARADDLETAARLLSRNLPTGLISVDAEGRIVELNEAARELLRLPGDAHGERYDQALAAVPEFCEVLGEVLSGGEPIGRREIRWASAGVARSFGVTATPAHGADGRFLGVLALFTDLTEVRKLEARVALTRHLSDLGQVSAGAAHEFRNASAAIDGFADLGLRSPERAAEHLRAIRREAQEMNRVTSDFLLFARPEGFAPEPVDLAAVTAEAAAETETAFPGAVVERGEHFPGVLGSEVLLRRALVNLLRNAVEATPPERRGEPGAIRLDSWQRDGEVFLAVGDRGEGVETPLREEIFLPFYSTKQRGSGFGLAIVARIAELHGGTVEVGVRPDGGALFTLRLPAPAGERPPTPSSPA